MADQKSGSQSRKSDDNARKAEDTAKKTAEQAEETGKEALDTAEEMADRTGRATAEAADSVVRLMAGASPEDMNEIAAFQRRTTSMLLAMNREMLKFTQQRLRADAETYSRLVNCRDMGSLVSLQLDWADNAVQDYLTESRHILEMGAEVWQEGAEQGQRTAKSATRGGRQRAG